MENLNFLQEALLKIKSKLEEDRRFLNREQALEKLAEKPRNPSSFSLFGSKGFTCSPAIYDLLCNHKDELRFFIGVDDPDIAGAPPTGIFFGNDWFIGSGQLLPQKYPLHLIGRLFIGQSLKNKGSLEGIPEAGRRFVGEDNKVVLCSQFLPSEGDFHAALFLAKYKDDNERYLGQETISFESHRDDDQKQGAEYIRLLPAKKFKSHTGTYSGVTLTTSARDVLEGEFWLLSKALSEFNFSYISQKKSEASQRYAAKVSSNRQTVIDLFDPDGDSMVDIQASAPFGQLIKLNQKQIIEVDRDYVQKFVKLNLYLINKSSNINLIFKTICEIENLGELKKLAGGLNLQVKTYEQLLIHSYMLLEALLQDDMVSFYEIYEALDKLGIFESSWERSVSSKLSTIDSGIRSLEMRLVDVLESIKEMESSICNQLDSLAAVTEASLSSLGNSINSRLDGIGQKVDVTNMLHKKHLEKIGAI